MCFAPCDNYIESPLAEKTKSANLSQKKQPIVLFSAKAMSLADSICTISVPSDATALSGYCGFVSVHKKVPSHRFIAM